MQITDKELNKLLEEVEKEFTLHLTKAEEDFKSSKLAKSEEANSAAPSLAKAEFEKKDEEKKPEHKDEEKKEEHKEEPKEHSEEKPAAEGKEEASKEAAPAAEGEKAPGEEGKEAAPAAEGEDHCDYDDEDKEHMHKMYSSMSKGELKAHHEAVKMAYEHHGLAKCGEMMGKSESDVSVVVSKPDSEVELLKTELSATKAKSEELKKTLETVTEFVTKLATKKAAPAAKAVTSLEFIAKSEGSVEEKELTKGEVTEKLAKKAADPTLTKSDRNAINAFYLSNGSINSIRHLLK